MQLEISFFSHHVDADGTAPLPKWMLSAISPYPTPHRASSNFLGGSIITTVPSLNPVQSLTQAVNHQMDLWSMEPVRVPSFRIGRLVLAFHRRSRLAVAHDSPKCSQNQLHVSWASTYTTHLLSNQRTTDMLGLLIWLIYMPAYMGLED